MYSCGPPHMANQKQDGQLEHTYSSYVMIRDVTRKTRQRWWMTERRGERGSGISVLAARHDDEEEDRLYDDVVYVDESRKVMEIGRVFGYLTEVESTEKDIETRLTKAWTAINRLSTIWKSDLTDKMKRSFFQAAVTSILLYGCTTWTLTKRLEKKLDGNYTRMLRAILNKSWQQHPTRHQLYGHLPPITKTIQVRRTRHAGHCWRSRDELIRDVLLWIPTHGRAKAGRPARTYIQQLCEDTGCYPEDLPRAMNDREEWRERVRDIRAASTIWWWWRRRNRNILSVGKRKDYPLCWRRNYSCVGRRVYFIYGTGVKVYVWRIFPCLMISTEKFWTRVRIELDREIYMNKWINKSMLVNCWKIEKR